VRLAIDAWDPSYGSGTEGSALVPSEAPVDIDAEVPIGEWAPRAPSAAASPWASVLFVDGVRRVDARAWITDDRGVTRQGICASYAAGAVRSNGEATVALAEVRRGLFCCAEGADDVVTDHGTFVLRATPADDPDTLSLALQRQMGDLEVAVAQAARAGSGLPSEPIVVDGPLRQHRLLPGAVGYIKTLHSAYGPPVVLEVAGRLAAGERTPLFVVGEGFTRWSWYLRLPGERTHPLAGIVRCEAAADLPVGEAALLADTATVSLPRYASRPHKDTRAPQNLYPIAGLERALRRRLGDAALLQRALRKAAAATPAA
jgi:hypothetical protein